MLRADMVLMPPCCRRYDTSHISINETRTSTQHTLLMLLLRYANER